MALFTIKRDAGTFTQVSVDWEVTTVGSEVDIFPTSGRVIFEDGQDTGSFEIQALPDEVKVYIGTVS